MTQDIRTREFYNQYGIREWERMDKTPYDYLNFLLHMDFIGSEIKEGIELCDVGCGAGRYSIEFAQRGCNITLVDISDVQLDLAKQKIIEYGQSSRLKAAYNTSLLDMNDIESNSFDITVCYGAPLNYLFDNYRDGIAELYRITKPGGQVFVSVNSRLGVLRMLYGNENFDMVSFLEKSEYWYIDQVIETGDLPEHPEVNQPPRHFFNALELENLFEEVGFTNVELASSPCMMSGLRTRVDEINKSESAWNEMLRQELLLYRNRQLSDSGEFLVLRATK